MPKNDPYLRDRNVSSAAGVNLAGGLLFGALLGWAVVGWFDLGVSDALGAIIGAVVGAFVATVLLGQYGGRSTR